MLRWDEAGGVWDPEAVAAPAAAVHTLALHPTNPEVVYAGGPGGFYRRSAAGEWTTTTAMAGIVSIATDAAHPSHVYAANATNVYRSTDTGLTWKSLGLVTDVNAIAVGYGGQTVFVATDGWGVKTYRFDLVAPSAVTMTKPTARFQTTTGVPTAWRATDAESGVASYDIEVRSASSSGGFGAFAPIRSRTTATTATLQATPGRTYCLRGRARDRGGNVGPTGGPRCTIVPLNDTQLAAGEGWARVQRRGHYLGSYSEAAKRGSVLQRKDVQVRSLALLATTCPDCGNVKVLFNGNVIRRIDLASAGTAKRQVLAIKRFDAVRSGTVKIVVTSSGKPVLIEGLGAGRV